MIASVSVAAVGPRPTAAPLITAKQSQTHDNVVEA